MTVKQVWLHLITIIAVWIGGEARARDVRELRVHVAQANNDSPYAFVRAKFEPGEVTDPWAVRFFDDKGAEVPYFVWDLVTWQVARGGRGDWGQRYALINHAPGDAPEVVEARGKKLQAARKTFPELAARLDARDQAAAKAPGSVCAALYLLRHRTPAFGKERLALRVYPERQVAPKQRHWKGQKVGERIAAGQGGLSFRDLPDQLAVVWQGKEVFRSAGFRAGDLAGAVSHADPGRPFVVETTEGIVTRVTVTAQTAGRRNGSMGWQCSYWLFPEGGVVALEGFSLSDAGGYPGGPQKLSIWQADGDFTAAHLPDWDRPWWLHRAGAGGFVATHLFSATPLTIGYGNNPFTVNSEGPDRDPRVEADGNRLTLCWSHRIDDPAVRRLLAPEPLRRPSDPPPKDPPRAVRWQPKVDWLYRQYVAGIGDRAEAAEGALRAVLGAAAGWIDQPVSEEDVAALLVSAMPRIASSRESAEIGLLKVVPAALADDPAATRKALSGMRDQAARTDYYINLIRRHVERGGKPSEGRKKDDPDGTPREGWTGNPCYHAALMPCYVRVLEHFELPFPQREYREAILRYADFSLELLGGKPIDFDRLNVICQGEWPSRIVPLIPLVLHAYTLKPEEKYAHAAKMLFEDLTRLVARNPHGYWPTWTFNPRADKFDTVYNPVGYERGITAPWSEGLLDVIGREAAARFVTAQARWLVFSGQLLDTLEIDNATAIRASTHGGHTSIRNQIGIYLYDDFAFYRGLVGDLVAWSAATAQEPERLDGLGTGPYRSLELSNAGSSMLRWALAIGPGSKWRESKVQRLPTNGFRLQAWNRRTQAKSTFTVAAEDLGLATKGEALCVQLSEPAFRLPAEFEVTGTDDKLSLKVTRPAKVRLGYHTLRPGWPADAKPVLERRGGGGSGEVAWDSGSVEWQATPGEYELRAPKK
jgi:hypothetical protein